MNKLPLNRFLQSRAEVHQCTQFLKDNNLIPHGIEPKDFDLAHIVPYLGDGNFLDMGSYGSSVLYNVVRRGLQGLKYGIDLAYPEGYVLMDGPNYNTPTPGVECFSGSLMQTPFEDGLFKYITCLSVIEHEVDYNKLAKECSRLLQQNGELFITFDYWNPKVNTSGIKLFDLDWNILDKQDVLNLIQACNDHGLHLDQDIDWTTSEQVINPNYCAPANVSYTFGILKFTKK